MLEQDAFSQAAAALHEVFLFVQQVLMSSPSSGSPYPHDNSVAVGVAITAVAGVAVAAAVGGTLLYNRRSPFNRRRRKKYPLTQKQWRDAFDGESGRLVDQYRVLKKIRFGGIEPAIRAEVWLFLLGFYELDSTHEEREAEKARKREVYRDLKVQSSRLRDSLYEESSDGDGRVASIETGSEGSSSPSTATDNVLERKASATDDVTSELESGEDNAEEESKGGHTNLQSASKIESVYLKDGCNKASEDFITWQRIIRLDAVRMNAEWVPYSPTQANVTEEVACELASSVGLKDDEHLEPCRQHHAARLVAILEAYALYDPETGYCQGMSDLLSPFVALLDEDYEAFWCFAQFMNTARYNFRLDEIGIRRQLNKVSSILKAGDPHLYSHLENIHAEDCTFVYRMVVVLLRRELSFEQTISLWEILWAEKRAVGVNHPKSSWRKARRRKKAPVTEDLLLYVIAAAVRQKKKIIMERCRAMDDVLRECNSMAGKLDVWTLIDEARELVTAVHGQLSD